MISRQSTQSSQIHKEVVEILAPHFISYNESVQSNRIHAKMIDLLNNTHITDSVRLTRFTNDISLLVFNKNAKHVSGQEREVEPLHMDKLVETLISYFKSKILKKKHNEIGSKILMILREGKRDGYECLLEPNFVLLPIDPIHIGGDGQYLRHFRAFIYSLPAKMRNQFITGDKNCFDHDNSLDNLDFIEYEPLPNLKNYINAPGLAWPTFYSSYVQQRKQLHAVLNFCKQNAIDFTNIVKSRRVYYFRESLSPNLNALITSLSKEEREVTRLVSAFMQHIPEEMKNVYMTGDANAFSQIEILDKLGFNKIAPMHDFHNKEILDAIQKIDLNLLLQVNHKVSEAIEKDRALINTSTVRIISVSGGSPLHARAKPPSIQHEETQKLDSPRFGTP